MTIIAISVVVAGLVALFLGHRLYWLFVTVIGFGAGVLFAPQLLPGQSNVIHLMASLACGFVGTMLTLVLRKTAAGIAAFGLGAYFAFWILEFFRIFLNRHQLEWWIAFVVGGACLAILVFAAFDYGLIFAASVAGSMMITEAVRGPLALSPASTILTFSVLLVIGLVAQTFLYKQA